MIIISQMRRLSHTIDASTCMADFCNGVSTVHHSRTRFPAFSYFVSFAKYDRDSAHVHPVGIFLIYICLNMNMQSPCYDERDR